MSAGAIRAGAAYVELFLRDNRLTKGLNAAKAKLMAFGATIRGVGMQMTGLAAVALAPLALMSKAAIEAGSQLADMAGRTGASVEGLSALGFAAEQSGTSLEAVEGGMAKMQKTLHKAAEGSATAVDTLADLGLSLADLQGLSPEEQFAKVGDSLDGIGDPATRAALAMEIFGDSGRELLPMAGHIGELAARAKELGIVLSADQAAALSSLGDAGDELKSTLKGVGMQLIANLAPHIEVVVKKITGIVAIVGKWLNENQGLVLSIVKVVGVVAGIGAGLVVVGTLFSAIGIAAGGLAAAMSFVGAAVGVVGSVLAAIVSPIGLAIAAVAGLTAWLLHVTGAGKKAAGFLKDVFGVLKTDVLETFDGIKNAMAAGDFGLAAKILWATLRLEWERGIQFLEGKWLDFKGFFQKVFTDAVFGVASIATDAWAGMQTAWVETVDFLADAWSTFTSMFTKGWRTAQNFVSKGVLQVMKLFDSSIDVKGASATLDADLAKDNAATDSERDAAITTRDQARREKLAGIEGERTGTQEQLAAAHASELAGIQAATAKRLREMDAELKGLQAERAKLLGAATAAAAKEAKDKTKAVGTGVAEAAAQARGTGLSGGTFSTSAVAMFGGGSTASRMLTASEETARNTRKIVGKIGPPGIMVANR